DRAGVDLLDVLLIGMVAVVSLFFFTLVAYGVYSFTHRWQHLSTDALNKQFSHNTIYLVFVQFAAYVFLIGFMGLLTWTRHRLSLFEAISWNAPSVRPAWYAIAGGIALAFVSDIGDIVLNPWTPKSLPITEMFKDRPSALLLAAFGILV